MRQGISADPAVLAELHRAHPWIPDYGMVRPSSETTLAKINAPPMGDDVAVCIWRDVFACSGEPLSPCCVLLDQRFPYAVSEDTRHMVCWFSGRDANQWTDSEVAALVSAEVDRLHPEDDGREFVFYSNPKPSVVHPRIHHVQVFVRRTASIRARQGLHDAQAIRAELLEHF